MGASCREDIACSPGTVDKSAVCVKGEHQFLIFTLVSRIAVVASEAIF